jgi:ATP/maltotriose-dependent transcriptional regulator MalT
MAESIRLSEAIGFISPLIIVRADLAMIYGALGAFDRAVEIARLAVDVAETKMPIFRIYALATLARLYVEQGQLVEADTLIDQMKKDPHRDGYIFPAMRLQAEGELALAQGHYKQARTIAAEAVKQLQQSGVRILLPAALYLQGRSALSLGQPDAARACWQAARAEAEAIGSRRMLWQILAVLSPLERDPGEAEQLRRQARELVTCIAEHTPSDLRASFLALPAVRAIISYVESSDGIE